MDNRDSQCHAHAHFAFDASLNMMRYRELADKTSGPEQVFWKDTITEVERYIVTRADRLIGLRSMTCLE